MSSLRAQGSRPADEADRLEVLADLHVLDQPPDGTLDGLTRLAAYVCGTPRAEVNLIDSFRQWQASAYGAAPGEIDRDDSMCTHAILSRDVTYTPDASSTPTFGDNPFVNGERGDIRLYVAAPLVASSGHVMGTLCAWSPEVRELDRTQIERMRDLACTVMSLLELRRTAGVLAHAATRDPLTGLPNRSLLLETLERALARRSRDITSPSLLFVDLDGFKAINDQHGHATGDTVLNQVAGILTESVRATDLVARIGGDEFVVLVEEAEDSTEPDADGGETLADRLRRDLTFDAELPDGGSVHVSASVGVATAGNEKDTATDLLAMADLAMYEEKVTPGD